MSVVSTAARIIAVGNLKGGTGKSTLAVNLACAIAAGGRRRVAVIDTDPQGTATRWASRGKLPAACRSLPIRDFAQAGEWLDEVDDLRREHDALVIDLPAVLSPALGSAFMLADLILVPSSASEIDVFATVRTLHYVRLARAERPANPPRVLIVPSSMPSRPWWGGDGATAAEFARLQEPISPPVHLRPEHPAAFAACEWVGGHAPGSAAHKDILAVEAAAVAALGREHALPTAAGRRTEAAVGAEASAREYLARRGERSGTRRLWWRRAVS